MRGLRQRLVGAKPLLRAFAGLVLSSVCSYPGVADPPRQDERVTCSIELAMIAAPAHYLVAQIKHVRLSRCDAATCIESLSVVHRIAAGAGAEHLTAFEAQVPLETTAVRPDIGSTWVAVYVPDPRNQGYFGPLTESYPGNAAMIANYEASVKAARTAGGKAPRCRTQASSRP